MATIVKFLIAAALSLFLSSCQIDRVWGVSGNGNVQTEKRDITSEVTAIKASNGLRVHISQETKPSVTVEADENLLDIIYTEVRGNELRIYTQKNINHAKARKVSVTLPEITAISSSSGASILVDNILNADRLELKSTSGSSLKLETTAGYVSCNVSSGADIGIKGSANTLNARASSGGTVRARDLEVSACDAKASSGGSISIHVTDNLTAKASSGGDIRYSGNPKSVSTGKAVSGSVRKN